MEFAFFLARLPVAVLGSVVLLAIGWPLEVVLGIFVFPIKAIIHPKDLIMVDYRYWPRNTFHSVARIWQWTTGKSIVGHHHTEAGLRHFLENLF